MDTKGWSYKEFFVTELESERGGICSRCGRDITYNYVLTHPLYGEAIVGMECIWSIVDHKTMKGLMHDFRGAQNQIVKHRFKNRLDKVSKSISSILLSALVIKIADKKVPAKQIFTVLHQKISDNILPSKMEIEALRCLEQAVGL